MKTTLDGKLQSLMSDPTLQSLVQQIEAIPVSPLSDDSWTARQLYEKGSFEDLGTEFNRKDLALSHLYSGLAVLSSNIVRYLHQNPRDDADNFLRFTKEVFDVEHPIHGMQAFPVYQGKSPLPNTLHGIEERGYASVLPLSGPGLGETLIVYEWTFKPGKRFFLKVSRAASKTICGKGGPYEAFQREDGLLGQADLPRAVAASAVVGAFAPPVFWYPLAAYVGLLVVKTGLKTYCEE